MKSHQHLPRLIAITDGTGDRQRIVSRAVRWLQTGQVLVRLREPSLDVSELSELVATIRDKTDSPWLVVTHDLAPAGTFGHLNEPALAALNVAPDGPTGASVHSVDSARRADRFGLAYILVSPVFPPSCKESPAIGESGFVTIANAFAGPAFALGGMTPERAQRWLRDGHYGVAAMSATFGPNQRPIDDWLAVLDAAGNPNGSDMT